MYGDDNFEVTGFFYEYTFAKNEKKKSINILVRIARTQELKPSRLQETLHVPSASV